MPTRRSPPSSRSAPASPPPLPEYRRYWHHGVITHTELWLGADIVATEPRRLPRPRHETDYCAVDRLRIYADLPCAYCGERPGPPGDAEAEADAGAEAAELAPGAGAHEPGDERQDPGAT